MFLSTFRVTKTVNSTISRLLLLVAVLLAIVTGHVVPRGLGLAYAQAAAPAMLHPNLGVRAVATGLTMPTNIAFTGGVDAFVIEKSTGRVLHFVNGAFRGIALDLSVNNASERGLLGIAVHPRFPADPGVYLYWTCRGTVPEDADPFVPEQAACPDPASALPDSDKKEQTRNCSVDCFCYAEGG